MREKLIDLLTKLLSTPINIYVDEIREIGVATVIADYLIAHGVTVQKKGHWIHDIYNSYGCSECGKRETMSHRNLKNYCPNCGAKMDGET